jgi:methylphosphotriester-DNA--protein-cysteine methyltransferase
MVNFNDGPKNDGPKNDGPRNDDRQAIRCEQVWHEISNYLEGDVDAASRTAMDEHFRSCARCKSVLEGTRNVVQLYSDERLIEEVMIAEARTDEQTIAVPAGFSRRLQKRLMQNARGSGSRWSTWSAWLVPLAALVLIAGGLRVANSLTVNYPMRSAHAQPGHDIPPDMPVVVSAGAKLFHAAGCPFIHNKETERTLTAQEAIREGYMPCMRCLRKYLETATAGHAALGDEANQVDMDDPDDHNGGQ